MQIRDLDNPDPIVHFQTAYAIKGLSKLLVFHIIAANHSNGRCNSHKEYTYNKEKKNTQVSP